MAWYVRWAMIMLTSSLLMSTLDDSVAWPTTVDMPLEPGWPRIGWPEAAVSFQALLPTGCRPCRLAKSASTIVPTTWVSPLV
ncbi:hypothetical protein D3C72_2354650 [compost metagenome]